MITVRLKVTPKRDGTILWKGKEIGVVRRPKERRDRSGSRRRAWECVQRVGDAADANRAEMFIQQCDTRREGIVRLLIIAGAI